MKTILRYFFVLTSFLSVPLFVKAQSESLYGNGVVSVKELRHIHHEERLLREEFLTTMVGRNSQFAIKANLLRWITFTPELGLVWRCHPQWDLQFSMGFCSASWHQQERRYALWFASPEIRRYFGLKKRWYLGAQVEVSERDYKFTETGREGMIFGSGLTGGYLWRVGSRTSIDFNIGAGYNGGDMKIYTLEVPSEGQKLVRTNHGSEYCRYFGINHLGISLVWDL